MKLIKVDEKTFFKHIGNKDVILRYVNREITYWELRHTHRVCGKTITRCEKYRYVEEYYINEEFLNK